MTAQRREGAILEMVDPRPYSEDIAAQLFVATFPDGATLEQIGEAFGVTRERIRQVEVDALETLRNRAAAHGLDERDLAAALASRGAANDHQIPGEAGLLMTGPKRDARTDPLPLVLYSDAGARLEAAVLELERCAALRAKRQQMNGSKAPQGGRVPDSKPAEYEWNGKTQSCSAWARELGIRLSTVQYRRLHGMNPDGTKRVCAGAQETPAEFPIDRERGRLVDPQNGPLAGLAARVRRAEATQASEPREIARTGTGVLIWVPLR